jgi:shikimate dehydrogenase
MAMTDRPIPRAFVMGHPIAHSRSPMLHGYWLDRLGIAGAYDRCDVPPEELESFFASLKAKGYVGGNITVPHKTAAMTHVARLDDAAKAIGAVNTIWLEDGRFVGGNTDSTGFLGNLDDRSPGWDADGRFAVVLGAGGAARAATYGLLQRGFSVHLVNRTFEHAEALARHFGADVTAHHWDELGSLLPQTDLLVNATSLGMLAKPPLEIDLSGLKPSAVVHDVVYVPLETGLLKAATARGHRIVDGLGMLLHQAVAGFEHWFGVRPVVTDDLRRLIESDIREKTPGA